MADELSIDSKALIFATLADVYLSSNMLDEAISILKDGLARNPNYTLAKIILGRAYYMKGENDEALKLLESIYPEAKDSENENLFLGHCYKKRGEPDQARKHYETVLRINPDNKEAKKELAALSAKPAEKPAEVIQKAEVPVSATEPTVKAAEAPKEPPLQGTKKEPPLQGTEKEPLPVAETAIPAEVKEDLTGKPTIEIKGMEETVKINEVILPEVDISSVKESPEPEMVVQEPVLKITTPPPVSETIVKGEVEIVLPAEPPKKAEVPVSGAEVIQKAEVPVSGARVPVTPIEETKAPVEEIKVSMEEAKAPKKAKKVPVRETKEEKPAPEIVEKPAEVPTTPPPLFAEEMKPEPAVAPGTPAAETGTPFDRLNEPMKKLISLKTVNAAFISAQDGLLIKNYSEKREDVEEISALIAAVFNEALESFKFLNEGLVEKCIIEKPGETICVITAGESLLCVITEPEAKPGLIFVYARKIIDEIREVLG